MTDFTQAIAEHKDLSEKDQKKAGLAIAGKMQPQHYAFLKLITDLFEKGDLDVLAPQSFLNLSFYNRLPERDRSQIDLALVNIADLMRHVYEFYRSKKTPDESPQLENMIEQLFLMKQRVEKRHGDVFKF